MDIQKTKKSQQHDFKILIIRMSLCIEFNKSPHNWNAVASVSSFGKQFKDM